MSTFSWFILRDYGYRPELASGWDFFAIPNPESWSRGFGIGIFYFGLDRKIPEIPKSRGSGSGFENPEKIPKEKSRKSQNPGDRDRDFKTSKKSRVRNPENPEILGIGIRIWKSRTNPEKIPRKIPKKSRVKNSKIPGIGIYFRGLGYPDKKPPLVIDYNL